MLYRLITADGLAHDCIRPTADATWNLYFVSWELPRTSSMIYMYASPCAEMRVMIKAVPADS